MKSSEPQLKTTAPLTGWPGGQYQPLAPEAVERIIAGALEVLERAGIYVGSDTAIKAFRRHGVRIEETRRIAYLPAELVQECLARAPRPVTLYGREERHHCCLQGQQVHVGTGGTALYVLDLETGKRRRSTLSDVAACARLCDALENVHIFTINVFPNEIEHVDDIDINRFYWAIANTSKHVMGGCYSYKGMQQVVEMAQIIAGGKEALRDQPFVSFITLLISPLKIDELYGEMACYAAQQGLPVVMATEPICGTTSPVTLAGNIVMHIAEMLAGLTLVQCVNPQAPVICGSVGAITDLRTMHHVAGAIERGLIQAAIAQIAQRLDLPLYSTAGTSDAKIPDAQAAYESALSNLLVCMSGAHYIHDACGLMESDLTVSYEKMIIDNEILGMCARVLQGIEITEETLAIELICAQGPGQAYFSEEHTVKHMRQEFFQPALADREPREIWQEQGALTATERARQRARALLASHQPLPLSEHVHAAICARFPNIRKKEST